MQNLILLVLAHLELDIVQVAVVQAVVQAVVHRYQLLNLQALLLVVSSASLLLQQESMWA